MSSSDDEMYEHKKYLIYRIRTSGCPPDLTYIGSTEYQYHMIRWGSHERDYKKYLNGNKHTCSSMLIYKAQNAIEPDSCVVYEQLEIVSVEEKSKKEGQYIRNEMNDDNVMCVNKNIAGRSQSQYYIDNRDKHNEQMRYYYQDNREIIKEKARKRYNKQKKIRLDELTKGSAL